MQSDTLLDEGFALILLGTGLDADRRSSAYAVVEALAIEHRRHAKPRQQLAVEGARKVEPADGQDDVRHAVDLDRHGPSRDVHMHGA